MRLSLRKEVGFLLFALLASGVALVPMADPESSSGQALGFILDPRLDTIAAAIAGFWVFARLGMVLNARAWWGGWTRSPSWVIEAADLPLEERRVGWLPRALTRFLPVADKGILIGRGFQWTPQHTQDLETFMRDGARPLPTGTDARGGYPALHAVGKAQERPLVLPFSELVGHVLIGGTTRSGKTRLLEVIVCEAIRAPGTVVVIDPKGDADLLIRAASQARRTGREFRFFSPAFPHASRTFNPFSTCENTTELAARVQALMPGGGAMAKDPFFTEYPLAIIERLGAAQAAVGDKWSIEGLNAVTTLVPPLEDLIAKYLHRVVFERGGDIAPLKELKAEYAQSGKRDLLADALIDDHDKPRDHFQKVTANLTPAFRGVTGGDMGRLLSTIPPDLSWKQMVEGSEGKGMVAYFFDEQPDVRRGVEPHRAGDPAGPDRLSGAALRLRGSGADVADDDLAGRVQQHRLSGLHRRPEQGRRGEGAFPAGDAVAWRTPESAMGRDGTQRVLDNLNTRIWFRLTDDRTAQVATEGLGFHQRGVRGGGSQPELRRCRRSWWATPAPACRGWKSR